MPENYMQALQPLLLRGRQSISQESAFSPTCRKWRRFHQQHEQFQRTQGKQHWDQRHRRWISSKTRLCLSSGNENSSINPPTNHTMLLDATQRWFEKVVIGERLCPFAPPLLVRQDLLRSVVCDAVSINEVVHLVRHEAKELVAGLEGKAMSREPNHETTLIVFPYENPIVQDFRDFVRVSWTLQEKAILNPGYQSDLQLVLFHPRATHQTYGTSLEVDNPADYTIRSPYPTIHVLREVDVMRAVKGGYPSLESLPSRNQKKMLDQGLETCQRRLAKCYHEGSLESGGGETKKIKK